MRYLLLLAVVLVSLCTGLPDIPFINPVNNTASPRTLAIDSPDLFIGIDTVPAEVKPNRSVNTFFELRNKNNYDLKNVKLTIYDPCIFTGDTEKDIGIIKANGTKTFSLKLTSENTDLDENCNLKFRVEYDTNYSLYQSIAVLKKEEYEQREIAGTLNSIPINAMYPSSPLKISLTFSDEQPFIENENKYLHLDYFNVGDGLVTVNKGDIKIKIPTNIKDFSCGDYDSNLALNEDLNFFGNRASSSTCSFTTTATSPIDIKSLEVTASYKYALDNSISIRVRVK